MSSKIGNCTLLSDASEKLDGESCCYFYGHYATLGQLTCLLALFLISKWCKGGFRHLCMGFLSFLIWLLFFPEAVCHLTNDFKIMPTQPGLRDSSLGGLLLAPVLYVILCAAWRLRRRCALLKLTPWACCKTLPFVVEATKFGALRPITVHPDKDNRVTLTYMDGVTSSTEDKAVGLVQPTVICGPNATLKLVKVSSEGPSTTYKMAGAYTCESAL